MSSLPPLLQARTEALGPEVERRLESSLEELRGAGSGAPARLVDAMAHSLLAGGKRLRPLLVLEAARACAPGSEAEALERAWPAALAIEYVHTYSLIHDDLPALDDDELRRGRPTVHVAFDEATAILAGDALLTDAFRLVAAAPTRPAEQALVLARAAGSRGMVGGQMADVGSEGKERTLDELEAIHVRKTGRLFLAAAAMGGHASSADDDLIARLSAYGERLGLAFQIADDVLDVIGDVDARGKKQGGDVERDKATYVRLLGLEDAKKLAHDVAEEAATLLAPLGDKGEVLAELARFAADRSR